MADLSCNSLLISFSFLLLLGFSAAYSEDRKCLQGLKASLGDPKGQLSSWDFTNTSSGSICLFAGVDCWSDNDDSILGLHVPGLELTGEIPDSLQYCRRVMTLNLSSNALSGTIPSQICSWLPYLTSLDLSMNNFSGAIPAELGNCTFLNILKLSDNVLSGTIPSELARMQRLVQFSVADNKLSGKIPSVLSHFDRASFEKNKRLCGKPLRKDCNGPFAFLNRKIYRGFSAGEVLSVAVGFTIGFWVVFGTLMIQETWMNACYNLFVRVGDVVSIFMLLKTARIRNFLVRFANK